MGNCKNKRLIGPYLDGQLGDCQWLEEHIAECSECLAEYEAVQHINHLAGKADYPPPEGNYWNKFSTRVVARIAARPQTRRYPKFLESLFARKAAFKLASPLLAAVLALLVIKVYMPSNNIPTPGTIASVESETPVAVQAVVGDIVLWPKTIETGDIIAVESVNASTPEVTSSKIIEPVMVASSTQAQTETVAEDIQPGDLDYLVKDYIERRDMQIAPSRPTIIDNGYWTALARDLNFRTFDTDHVLKFQIISGSNPSLAPLSSYREATGKFFAPEISHSRGSFDTNLSNRWGYASGSEDYNEERQRHLELEFDLSREK